MIEAFHRFQSLPPADRRDVFAAAAVRLDTMAAYIEKDLWVCFVLDLLYHRLPGGLHGMLFKGGTSLSKAFGLIKRFSEDIDIVIDRAGLGFEGEGDPANPESRLSGKKRAQRFDELKAACSTYVLGDLREAIEAALGRHAPACRMDRDPDDPDAATLLIEYPTLYPAADLSYVRPRVKIECGARSAMDPACPCAVTPYIAGELGGWALKVEGIAAIRPERTYLEKLLILHGAFCGQRDEGRLPADTDRLSRHYYDVALMTATNTGRAALADHALLAAVRDHNLAAFRQAWKRFDEATPGTIHVVPQPALRSAVEKDYAAMQGMIHGEAPGFPWIMEQLTAAEAIVNGD
ncbi:MAG: nucleotidyl transferase AbiEii/AbiGii toxin family protein [Rhodospirillales bacterium]|nr:nucleotidyl transferase AbiEii/AbiGii toxin family protein [Rhodospirillales bacterium]